MRGGERRDGYREGCGGRKREWKRGGQEMRGMRWRDG